MSTLNVDKVDPSTGTALELGTSGDTITVPTGAGLTVVDEVKTNKISPATGAAFALGDSGDTFTVPSGATIVNSGTATGFGITAASFRPNAQPLIINGGMEVNQRGTVTDITTNTYGVDQWLTEGDDTTLTMSKDTDVPTGAGFGSSLKLDVTTAAGSVGASDLQILSTRLEGQNVQLFKKGTSDAETFTVAFWVKNTVAGDYIVYLGDDDNSREVSILYTIDSADTWEKKIVTLPADTTGAFNNDNGRSLRVKWYLDAGTDWTSGSLQTAWGSGSNTTRASGITTGWITDTANNFWLTGVQLEVGTYTSSTLPPFQHESYGDNLQRCYRYFQAFHPRGSGKAFGTTVAYLQVPLLTTMRSTPSYTQNAVWRVTNNDTGEFTQSSAGGGFDQSDANSGRLSGTNFSSLTDAQTIFAAPNGNVAAYFSAEL